MNRLHGALSVRLVYQLILVLFLVASLCHATDNPQIFGPQARWDAPETVKTRERDLLFLDPYTGHYQNLGYNYMGRLDDGTVFAFNIFRWRVGPAGAWGLSIAVRLSDGTVYTYGDRIPDKGLAMAEGRMSLRFDGGSIEGADGFYRIRLAVEGFSCDLTLRPVLSPWAPGNTYVYVDREEKAYSRLGVSSPRAEVSGSMVVHGRLIPATGDCYGERTLHNLPIHKLHSPTFAFHVYDSPAVPPEESWSLSVISATPHPSYRLPPVQLLLLARGRQWLFTGMDFSILPTAFREREDLAAPYPSQFLLYATRDGITFSGTYYSTHLYQNDDVLGQAPAFVRAIGSLFLRQPVMYRIAGNFEGAITLADGKRIPLQLTGPAEYAVLK